jgi:hypothetical protein
MNRLKKVVPVVFLSGLLAVSLASSASAQQVPASSQKVIATQVAKADLVAEKVEVKLAYELDGMTYLDISFTIYNDSSVPIRNSPSAAGKAAWKADPKTVSTFENIMDYRDYPNGLYRMMGTVGWNLEGHTRFTYNMSLKVASSGRYQFRVRADSKNWIDESNESNNEKTAIWPPLPVIPLPVRRSPD